MKLTAEHLLSPAPWRALLASLSADLRLDGAEDREVLSKRLEAATAGFLPCVLTRLATLLGIELHEGGLNARQIADGWATMST